MAARKQRNALDVLLTASAQAQAQIHLLDVYLYCPAGAAAANRGKEEALIYEAFV